LSTQQNEKKGPDISAGARQLRRLLPALPLIPGLDLLAGFILGDSISLLNDPFEPFPAAVDLG
jgi:hypothetical protein